MLVRFVALCLLLSSTLDPVVEQSLRPRPCCLWTGLVVQVALYAMTHNPPLGDLGVRRQLMRIVHPYIHAHDDRACHTGTAAILGFHRMLMDPSRLETVFNCTHPMIHAVS